MDEATEMHKPRICFVSENIYPLLNKDINVDFIGGAELQQLLIGQELANRGYRVSYITMNHGQEVLENIGPFKVISTYRPREGIPILRFVYPKLVKIWRALAQSDADIYYVRCVGFVVSTRRDTSHLIRI